MKLTQPRRLLQPFGVKLTAPKIDQSQNLPTSSIPSDEICLIKETSDYFLGSEAIAKKIPNEHESRNFLCTGNVLKKRTRVAYIQSNNPSWYETQHESRDLGAARLRPFSTKATFELLVAGWLHQDELCIAQNLSIYCPKAIQISHRNAKFGNQLYLGCNICKIEEGASSRSDLPLFILDWETL